MTDLDIQVNTVVQGISCLGDCLPNLERLRFSSSSIMCVRELGHSYENLQVLWMSRCGLQELDGLSVMHSLQELYLAYNDLSDLAELKWLDSLAILDLEGNSVGQMHTLQDLEHCDRLRDLTLVGNPVCRDPAFSRRAVLDRLPQLRFFDDVHRDGEPEEPEVLHEDTSNLYLDLYLETDLELYLDLHLEAQGLSRGSITESGNTCSLETSRCGDCGLGSLSARGSTASDTFGEGLASQLIRPQRYRSSEVVRAVLARADISLDPCAGEPDDEEILTEWVKRARSKPCSLGSSFLPASRAASSCMDFDSSDRRHLDDASSRLTRGGLALAGNPLSALRSRRNGSSSVLASTPLCRDADGNIRDLLRRFQS